MADMSVTKNHSHAMPTFGPGRVIDPAKRRAITIAFFATMGALIVVAAVITLWSVFGGAIPPAEQPPVVINTPTTEPTRESTTAPTVEPTAEPTAEPTNEPTATPTEEPTVIPTTEPTATANPISIPENFMVKDEYWEFASFFYRPDGSPVYGEFYFVGFPEGMTLYAPMSGYVTLTRGTIAGVDHNTIRIAESADGPLEWDSFGPKTGGFISFVARGIDLLDIGAQNDVPYVEKGEPFAMVVKRAEVFPGTFGEKPELLVSINRRWMETLDVSAKDPREFMWLAIQILEEGD